MTSFWVYVQEGDIVGMVGKKPYREFTVSYRKINRLSDLGLVMTGVKSTGSKTVAIREAKDLVKKFSKRGFSTRLIISGCGKSNNGNFTYGDGKFWRT